MSEMISQLNYHYHSIQDLCKQLNEIMTSLNEPEVEIQSAVILTNDGLYGRGTQWSEQKLTTINDLLDYLLKSSAYDDDPIVQLQTLHKFANNLRNVISAKQKQIQKSKLIEKRIDVV